MRTFTSFLLIWSLFATLASAQEKTIVINELMADNTSIITDESGSYEDWIEIFNFGDQPVDLANMFFTDDYNEPRKFKILPGNSSTIVQPGSHLLLWADDDWEEGPLHLEFKLSRKGEKVAIYDADGETLIDSISFKTQLPNHSYGRKTDNNNIWVNFQTPTPGAPNKE